MFIGMAHRLLLGGVEGVFRKEADLLVVSQAACSMPRVIFWFVHDFPPAAQINIKVCTHSVKAKNGGVCPTLIATLRFL